MDERSWVILTILLTVAFVAAALLVVGWRRQAPPGQIGLKGTRLERSPALRRWQMLWLATLLAACVLGGAAFF